MWGTELFFNVFSIFFWFAVGSLVLGIGLAAFLGVFDGRAGARGGGEVPGIIKWPVLVLLWLMIGSFFDSL
jgi:hypothetical protein